jgi:PAS domain S-box-containing protein
LLSGASVTAWLLPGHAAAWAGLPAASARVLPAWQPGLAWAAVAGFAGLAAVLALALAHQLRAVRQARRREAAARSEAARLQDALLALGAALPAAIVIKDAAGQILVATAEAERISGRPAADLRNTAALTQLPLGPLRWLVGDDAHTRALLAPETVEQTIATAHGPADYRITRGPLRAADGSPTGLFWIGHDITAQRDAERRLRDSEAWYRLLFDANPLPMGVYDRETLQFLATNAAAQRQYGHSREEFLALALQDIRPPDDQSELNVRLALANSANDGEPQATGLWLHQRRDGSCFEVDVVISNLTFNNRPARLALARDVSQEREAQRKINDYQRELLALPQRLISHERAAIHRVAQVVHDGLGHALAVARLKVDQARFELLQQRTAALAELLPQISEQLDQAAGWMRSVLTDLRPPWLEEEGLAAALQHAVRCHDVGTGAAQVHLGIDVGCRTARWPAAVEHVAFQLAKEALVNASVHAQARDIEVRLTGDTTWLTLAVSDDGVGIPVDMVRGRAGHLGISGMHERATAVGGHVVVSPRTSGGTEVIFTWGNTT